MSANMIELSRTIKILLPFIFICLLIAFKNFDNFCNDYGERHLHTSFRVNNDPVHDDSIHEDKISSTGGSRIVNNKNINTISKIGNNIDNNGVTKLDVGTNSNSISKKNGGDSNTSYHSTDTGNEPGRAIIYKALTHLDNKINTAVEQARVRQGNLSLYSPSSSDEAATSKATVTTDYDITSPKKDKRRLCTSEELRLGEWRSNIRDRPPYIPSNSKCYKRDYLEQVTEWTEYNWYPFASETFHSDAVNSSNYEEEQCVFEPQFSETDYCRLANNMTVGFMGDSLTWEHFATLATRFGRKVGRHDLLRFRGDDGKVYDQRKGILFEVCNSTSKIGFYRNRYMMYLDNMLKNYNLDVIVMNTGAHIRSDKELIHGFRDSRSATGMKSIVNELAKHQERKRREEQRDFLAIWRTTTPGHHHCSNFTEPVNNRTLMEEHIKDKAERRYSWHIFERQNQLAIKEFRDYNEKLGSSSQPKLNYEILHGYDVTLLRPDGHVSEKDCLHNCDPGPVDVYNTILLHLLRLHENKKDEVSLPLEAK